MTRARKTLIALESTSYYHVCAVERDIRNRSQRVFNNVQSLPRYPARRYTPHV